MKNRKLVLLIVIASLVIGIVGCGIGQAPQNPQFPHDNTPTPPTIVTAPRIEHKDADQEKPQDDESDQHPYISITYGRNNFENATDREMAFYTYDLVTKQLREECVVPFDSDYATGVVSRSKNTLYYSQRREPGDLSTPDCLWGYDIQSGKSTMLEAENFSYNDITLLNPETLLVMTVTKRHTITPARFDLSSKSFTYTADANNEPFELYSSGPAPLNYNYKTRKFVYMYSNQEDMYLPDYLGFKTAIDKHIALISDDLKKNPEETFTISLPVSSELSWATQISEHELLVAVREVDVSGLTIESQYSYYCLVFNQDQTTFTRIDPPFPALSSVSNCVTLDDGYTYYCKLYNGKDKTSGLFSYCPSTGELIPILLDDAATEGHVVNFFVVGPQ